MVWIANFGPIEVGRVTDLDGTYFVTVNAVATNGNCGTQQPESNFAQSFNNFYEARAYAISFFDKRALPFIQWSPW